MAFFIATNRATSTPPPDMSETESKATTKSSKATKATDETKKRKAKTVAPTAACTFTSFSILLLP